MGAGDFRKIGVLMGGPSSEREVSLKSGAAVCAALREEGCDVLALDITSDDRAEVSRLLRESGISCAFIALHGRFGEDGQVQEILEELQIPYTGSGVAASRLAMDKLASRKIFEANGLGVPNYEVVHREYYDPQSALALGLRLPLVVKPVAAGSSIGLSVIDSRTELEAAIMEALAYDRRALIEEYVAGREITVGILGDHSLPVIEIVTQSRCFDFQAKYSAGRTDYLVPAQLSEQVSRRAQMQAHAAHKLLGCEGVSRVDMILDRSESLFILEVNTIPGLTGMSLLPKAALAAGVSFGELCTGLIKSAYEKTVIGQETV